MKITAREANRTSWTLVRKQTCPYCAAPPQSPCRRSSQRDDTSYARIMWHDHHKARKDQAIVASMFIIPEPLELSDL